MAGCCPAVSPSSAIGAAVYEANGVESDIRPGETVECYAARSGNTTGLQDDATENALDKIDNSSVPITRTPTVASVHVQFKLTAGSTRVPISWAMTNIPTGLTMSSAGLLSGTFDPSTLGKIFQVQVTANDGTGVIDTRAFTIAPSIGDSSTQIQLICPLPGAIVNSKFGPRMHPIQKVMKMHTGIDLKMADRSVKDVLAAADGEVVLAGGNPAAGYGIRVWVKHSTGSGAALCSTTYNHLAQVYVSVGQKVIAGQKVGKEGSTGASTGNHLHFECRLPDGKFIDPLPLIRDSLVVADKTLSNGDADPTSTSVQTGTAALSDHEVTAKQTSCAAFGPGYPPANPPETTSPTPASSSTDPFELAWYFTMQHEVGPFWDSTYPTDADVIAGAIDTSAQRRKDGYVNTPNFPGGETKFGIAQKPNPSMVVKTATYAQAKNTGYNNYWKSAPISCTSVAPLIGVMLFDMNYLHGGGNARTMYNNSGVSSVSTTASQAVQLAACQTLYNARVAFINQIPRPEFTKGWLKRAADGLAYVQSLPAL